MGDRCEVRITGRLVDRAHFEAEGFMMEKGGHELEPGVAEYYDEERNYGDIDGLSCDVPWFGAHGSGSGYGEGVFACDGNGEVAECEAYSGMPFATARWVNGTVVCDETDIKDAGLYFEMLDRAKAALAKAVPPDPEPEVVPPPAPPTPKATMTAAAQRVLAALNYDLPDDAKGFLQSALDELNAAIARE